jgi:glycosyltransferase involved in cell wall biosynthesis
VDDGSTVPRTDQNGFAQALRMHVDVVTLRRNLGHQRAIAVGLALIEKSILCRAVVVMDGDGEDAPADIVRLLDEQDRDEMPAVVFAERTKRSESVTFRFGYFAYRMLHRVLTGIPVRVGNFSVVPRSILSRIVVSSDLWNHYAAAVVRANLPMRLVPTARAQRIAGTSRMNFVALVTHGLSAMTVFGDRVAVRLLVASAAVVALVLAVAIGLTTAYVVGWDLVPAWNSLVWVVAATALVQLIALLLVFVFVVLGKRDQPGIVPLRDHELFVMSIDTWNEGG